MHIKKRKMLTDVLMLEAVAEGKCIAKIDDKVLFVPFTAPEDIVDVEVGRQKRNYMEGRVLRIKEPSKKRIEPRCKHFGVCGGCKWQHLKYDEQLKFKQKQVRDQLERIGKVELPESENILGSPEIFFFRNKLEYTFAPRKWFVNPLADGEEPAIEDVAALGFHLPGRFDKILDIEYCYLQPELSNDIRLFVKQYALQNGYGFYDARRPNRQNGQDEPNISVNTTTDGETSRDTPDRQSKDFSLRNMIIRNVGENFMVIIVVSKHDKEAIGNMLNAIAEKFPQVTSLYYIVNDKVNDSIGDLEAIHYSGEKCLTAEMPTFGDANQKLKFHISPKSFYQTNSTQAYHLYSIAAEMASLKNDDVVYDLYTGTGTIALFVARSVKKVVGIEYVEEAIKDATVNARDNSIDNVDFFYGDMAKVLTDEFVEKNGHPNVIITDPPREGMHLSVVEMLLRIAPERIVYISCNAATQARDLERLSEKYKVVRHRAVDMFPHTAHVESVCLLVRI
ncbi:MAG: 23S rRNA (uracil(1939)-C(5))-methyltransferase RlmD [Bacteroidales bacterium]|jgi:23S rRNA (uracil1939-C5)-methyltransferase|nr:23S rRNA (uracil(1939)-C(5))-methyltransferase RlmD [Bacteroidales bacterium]